jgi:hypothetical protein
MNVRLCEDEKLRQKWVKESDCRHWDGLTQREYCASPRPLRNARPRLGALRQKNEVRDAETRRRVIRQSRQQISSFRIGVSLGVNTHSESRHCVKGIAINLGRDKSQYEVGHAVILRTFASRVSPRSKCVINLRTDVECPQDCQVCASRPHYQNSTTNR